MLADDLLELGKIQNQDSVVFNIIVNQTDLSNALSHLQGIVEKRNTIPNLSHVRLIANSNNTLDLTTTDMDICATESINAEVNNSSALTIHSSTFYDIVRKLRSGAEISLSTSSDKAGKLRITCENSVFNLSYLNAKDFPVMSYGDYDVKFSISAKNLKSMIDKNRNHISTEETRYSLNGIFLHKISENNKDFLRAVATDGHRLSCVSIDLPKNADNMPSVILPRKSMIELKRILDSISDESQVDISVSQTKLLFSFNHLIFMTKLIDANFPEYSSLLPKESVFSMILIQKDIFADAIDRVLSITIDKNLAIKFRVRNNLLILSMYNSDSSSQEQIEIKSNVDELELGFNAKFLLDVLSVIDGDNIVIEFINRDVPCLIRSQEDETSKFVMMPINM